MLNLLAVGLCELFVDDAFSDVLASEVMSGMCK